MHRVASLYYAYGVAVSLLRVGQHLNESNSRQALLFQPHYTTDVLFVQATTRVSLPTSIEAEPSPFAAGGLFEYNVRHRR